MLDPRIVRARTKLITRHPFFGTLALSLRLVEDSDIPTMATDGTTLYYNTNFLDELTPRELMGVFVHEIYHCMLLHTTRRNSRNPLAWNMACDYAINPLVERAGFQLPKDHLWHQQFYGMSAEEIYPKLFRPTDAMAKMAGMGVVMDAASSVATKKKARIERQWKKLIKEAHDAAKDAGKAVAAGALPGSVLAIIEAADNPVIDWRSTLWRFADTSSKNDYTWSKPNKHYLHMGVILPGLRNEENIAKLGVVLDTSGSIDNNVAAAFMGEVNAILDRDIVDEIVAIQCDTIVQNVERYQKGDIINKEIKGRGGTRFSPALKWFVDNEPGVAALVYFTDLYCYDFGPEPGIPVLWVVYGPKARMPDTTVPFGEIIKLTRDNLG